MPDLPASASVCPVCNGLRTLSARCPICGQAAEDQGRYNDLFGPYSPYRPIEDVSRTNGLPDLTLGACAHVAVCRNCAHAFPVYIAEEGH
ncbi:hypothetical protein [Gorillibacterium sp. sgz500922]|uniref:hypothetical protein n=1 Tax=Gorillibacterium sp. sgz500922 TaxID=3446694 RepID=UPI003F669F52